MSMAVLQIRINRVPPLEYLTAGQTMVAFVAADVRQEVRVRRLDDSAGTYVRRDVFDRAMKDGSFVVV